MEGGRWTDGEGGGEKEGGKEKEGLLCTFYW